MALGDIVELDDRTLLVLGQELVVANNQPDVANALVHRVGDTLFMVDTGLTSTFRAALLRAVEQLGPVRELIVLTTHGHVDHVGNNDIADELAELRGVAASHFVPALDVPQMVDPRSYWTASFSRLTGVVPLPAPPSLVATKVVSLFQPLRPFAASTRRYEELPLEQITVGSSRMTGWTFADGVVQVLRSEGHCAGHVMVLLKDSKILHMSDELNGPCGVMHDADQVKLTAGLGAAATMVEQNHVATVTEGHGAAMIGEQATERLERMLSQSVALQGEAVAYLDVHPHATAAEFVADYATVAAAMGAGSPITNPIFTAMMALNTLQQCGLNADINGSKLERPALHAPAPSPTGMAKALKLAAAVPAVLLWRLRGKAT